MIVVVKGIIRRVAGIQKQGDSASLGEIFMELIPVVLNVLILLKNSRSPFDNAQGERKLH
jgi:hypothetical protein